jgi:hypothetical protein
MQMSTGKDSSACESSCTCTYGKHRNRFILTHGCYALASIVRGEENAAIRDKEIRVKEIQCAFYKRMVQEGVADALITALPMPDVSDENCMSAAQFGSLHTLFCLCDSDDNILAFGPRALRPVSQVMLSSFAHGNGNDDGDTRTELGRFSGLVLLEVIMKYMIKTTKNRRVKKNLGCVGDSRCLGNACVCLSGSTTVTVHIKLRECI